MRNFNITLTCGVLVAYALAAPTPAQTFLGPTPYLSFAGDSPFAGSTFQYFHLEDFEDALLNTPGVSLTCSDVAFCSAVSLIDPTGHDSVDEDDGVIDGSGLNGDDLYTQGNPASLTFNFDAGALGTLPTHAGLVWTDGTVGVTVTLEAFGPGGASLGMVGPSGGFADTSFFGQTAEDRFFGVISSGGISAITMTHSIPGGVEVDHLQYGAAYDTWTDLGGGTTGINGQPTLSGTGTLVGGTSASVDLANAPSNALLLAWISFAPTPFSALGGTIHAHPTANQLFFLADGSGDFSGSTTWPLGLSPGTQVWFQFLVQDGSVPAGITLSNGLLATTS